MTSEPMTSEPGRAVHPRYATPCTYVVDPGGAVEHCGAAPTRRYLLGWFCQAHAPRPAA